ncbi:MAG: diaminopimelate epimerase [Clostridia bacterium]|nr:diaminopimelate epimerase [Clostridia bacterium]
MKFIKMHGAGNDYVYVNCFAETVPDREKTAIAVSDRHFGIGGDGLICVDPSDVADCKMDMYNADGSRGKMCGNGVRCVAKLAYDAGIARKKEISVETLSGIKYITAITDSDGNMTGARVNMGAPILTPAEIPALYDGARAVAVPLEVCGETVPVTLVSMGNPHCVVYVDDVQTLEIEKVGVQYEHHPKFPDRINTEFIHIINDKELDMRVWERGSGETLACGTGTCAAVVASILNGYCKQDTDIKVNLLGGVLYINWSSADNNVYMTGPAETVFTGEYDLGKVSKA